MATGALSGIVVLDVDPRHFGDEALAAVELEHKKLPDTPTVLTGGGGLHIYFRAPLSQRIIRNSAGALGPGLDVRSDGGYVIVPPSQHGSGNLYRWEVSSGIGEVALAAPPDWLLRLILTLPLTPRKNSNDKRFPSHRIDFARLAAGIPEGDRDQELFRLACSLRQRGYNRELVERAVLDAARRCKPPFPEREAARKVASAWRYE